MTPCRELPQRGTPRFTDRRLISICDEVANGKVADPFDENDVTLVESQFSWNSLADFQDNMRSVQNAYRGGYHPRTDGIGLDSFVNARDAGLDARLQAEISAAIDAIAGIPFPFRNNLTATTRIEAAQAAIVAVLNTLETEVKPLLTD